MAPAPPSASRRAACWASTTAAACARLRVASGAVWLTQQADSRDIVLREGESFVIDRPGRTVVQALDPAELRLNAAAEATTSTYTRSLLKGIA